jgi:molybdate transport system substrate-binding protein
MKMPSRLAVIVGAAALLGVAVAWAAVRGLGARDQRPTQRELTVFAAASLRDVFADIAKSFRAEHPDVKVTLNFAGSQELTAQIEHGASADVIAVADMAHLRRLADQKLIGAPVAFACNEPVLIVPLSNPSGLEEFADLRKAQRIVLGGAAVPIGRYSEQILTKASVATPDFAASVLRQVASREMTVRHVLTKVAMGEADAGIVYRTDAASSDQVKVINIPPALNVTAQYPMAALMGAQVPDLAREWTSFVAMGRGHQALQIAGFGCPQ